MSGFATGSMNGAAGGPTNGEYLQRSSLHPRRAYHESRAATATYRLRTRYATRHAADGMGDTVSRLRSTTPTSLPAPSTTGTKQSMNAWGASDPASRSSATAS